MTGMREPIECILSWLRLIAQLMLAIIIIPIAIIYRELR